MKSQCCQSSFRHELVMAGLAISRAAGLVVYRILPEVYKRMWGGGRIMGGLKVGFVEYLTVILAGWKSTVSPTASQQLEGWKFRYCHVAGTRFDDRSRSAQ